MAKVLGESGRYVSQEAANQSRRIILLVVIVVSVLGMIEGFVLSSFIPSGALPAWVRSLILIAVLMGMLILSKWASKNSGLWKGNGLPCAVVPPAKRLSEQF